MTFNEILTTLCLVTGAYTIVKNTINFLFR